MTTTTETPRKSASAAKAAAKKAADATPPPSEPEPPEQTPALSIPELPPKPTTVTAALAAVIRDFRGVGRDQRSEQGYQYRGIEDITRQASTLFGRYGLVWVPRVIEREVRELTINNRPWTEDHLVVEYTVYGPSHGMLDHDSLSLGESVEDKIVVGPIHALGRDNSDKGVNKCMTQAYKYALLQVLCISDAADDGDKETHEADAHPPPAQANPFVVARDAIRNRLDVLTPEQKQEVRNFCANLEPAVEPIPAKWSDEVLEGVTALIDTMLIKADQDKQATQSQDVPAGPGPEVRSGPEPIHSAMCWCGEPIPGHTRNDHEPMTEEQVALVRDTGG